MVTTGSDFAMICFPQLSWRQGKVELAILLKILGDRMPIMAVSVDFNMLALLSFNMGIIFRY